MERIYQFRRVAPYPVAVAYGLDTASVRREFRARMLPNVITTGLACLVVIMLSAYAARAVEKRKQAEVGAAAARLAAELGERLRIALDGAGLAPFERDLRTGQGLWGERIRQLYGVGPELERNKLSDWMAIIHPGGQGARDGRFPFGDRRRTAQHRLPHHDAGRHGPLDRLARQPAVR